MRVNTRRGSTSGTLVSADQSPTFVPNMRRRNLALASELHARRHDYARAAAYG